MTTRDEDTLPFHLRTEAYDYALPDELVAQEPPPRRDAARLLHLDRSGGLADLHIPDLAGLLHPGDLLVLNDTRVNPSRIFGERAATGGRVELLVLGFDRGAVRCLLKTRGRPRSGESIRAGALHLSVRERHDDTTWTLETDLNEEAFWAQVAEAGRLPLPPYIRRNSTGDPRDELDRERYQTVYASKPGAVAAPTAGLHLTDELLAKVRDLGVEVTTLTLHVGLGTFKPVAAADVRDHPMHDEAWEVSPEAADAVNACRDRGGRVIPVGTTAVRVLETACGDDGRLRAGSGRTRLFIHEPWTFRLVDALLTNFHAPRSTLLMLVSALAGRERILEAYGHAVRARYRLLSYGDAMFIA